MFDGRRRDSPSGSRASADPPLVRDTTGANVWLATRGPRVSPRRGSDGRCFDPATCVSSSTGSIGWHPRLGGDIDVWKRTAQSVISMRHAGISDIPEGRPCPEPELVSPRPSSRRSRTSRAVTRSQAADETGIRSGETPPADTGENVQPDAGSTPVDTAHLPPSSSGYSTLPAATSVVWATDDNISNLEDIKHWHRDNRLLFDFLFLSTSGAAASFLRQLKPKRGELAHGKAAWDGMVRKYQNSTRQRRRILKQQLSRMVMTDGQDPDVFINDVYYLRDELVDMGEVFNDDSILDIVLEGLSDEYLQIKYSAEADDDFTFDRAVITMRNMYANRAMRNGPLRKAKGRESAMVVTSTPSVVSSDLFTLQQARPSIPKLL